MNGKPILRIKIAHAKPVKKAVMTSGKKSRRVLGIVVKDDNIFKVAVKHVNRDNSSDKYVIPFTPESLNLTNKTHVFLNKEHTNGRNICVIRDKNAAKFFPGTDNQYHVVRENILISGYIVKINDKMFFEYEDLIAFKGNGAHIQEVAIDEEKPLFKI